MKLSTKRNLLNGSDDMMRRMSSPHFTTKIEEVNKDVNAKKKKTI